jgi:hypothetical protein
MPPRAMVDHGSNVVDGGRLRHIISVGAGATARGSTTFKKINMSCNAPALKSEHGVAIFPAQIFFRSLNHGLHPWLPDFARFGAGRFKRKYGHNIPPAIQCADGIGPFPVTKQGTERLRLKLENKVFAYANKNLIQ